MSAPSPHWLPALTRLAGQGWSDARLADRFNVSERTIIRWRQRHGLASQWAPERAPHGSVGRWKTGCRCTPCRAANAACQRRYIERMQALTINAPRHGLRWTVEEDAVLLSLTIRDAAFTLGRTWSGCYERRARLARKNKRGASPSKH